MKISAVVFASLLLVAGASGCKTSTSAEGGSEKAPPAKTEKAPKAERAPKAEKSQKSEKSVKQAPPAGSPLARVKLGMQRSQVDDLIGEPTSTRVFPSGKAFNPFYYGPDTVRTGAFYKGLGRVVFSGAHIVVDIEYDPSEDGY